MIVTSLVLVVISAVSLLIGGLFREDLSLIYVSIGTALLAGAFLLVGVMRGGGAKAKATRRATLPGEDAEGSPATWQGAGWGGAAPPEDALARDEGEPVPAPVIATAEDAPTTELGSPTAPDDAVFAPPASTPAPAPPAPAPPAPSAPAASPSGPSWAPPPPPAAPPAAPRPRSGDGAAPPPPPPPPPAG